MTDKIKEFYNFLNKCKRCGIRLKSVRYDEKNNLYIYHFCRVRFIGNNTYFCDDDFWTNIDALIPMEKVYDFVMEDVCTRYKITKS